MVLKKLLHLSSNVTRDSKDKTYFLHKWLLTDEQVSELCKSLANNLSKFIEMWASKILQSGGFLDRWTSWTITKDWFTFNEKYT